MTSLDWLRIAWNDSRLIPHIKSIEVTKDQLETIIDDWLVLDDRQCEYVNSDVVWARAFHLDAIRYFTSSKKIDNDRLVLINMLSSNKYKYYVKEKPTHD